MSSSGERAMMPTHNWQPWHGAAAGCTLELLVFLVYPATFLCGLFVYKVNDAATTVRRFRFRTEWCTSGALLEEKITAEREL